MDSVSICLHLHAQFDDGKNSRSGANSIILFSRKVTMVKFQIMLCSIYGICKVVGFEMQFRRIVTEYRQLPSSSSEVKGIQIKDSVFKKYFLRCIVKR